jgi:predicted nucleotidyltransferase
MSTSHLKMLFPKHLPAESLSSLRERVGRFIEKPFSKSSEDQMALDLFSSQSMVEDSHVNYSSVSDFLDFISNSIPMGELYLFGGVLRDFALFGRKGFNSDIDLVVDGDWDNCVSYLVYIGAKLNKFGGYRLSISGQPIDIWNAKETWAIKENLVEYKGIASLLETTVLNWDAILMNWRSKKFICQNSYLYDIQERALDVILEENPNPLGMAVRVFRHLCLKDAAKITPTAAGYLSRCAIKYPLVELIASEKQSYGDSVIKHDIYEFFEKLDDQSGESIQEKFDLASKKFKKGSDSSITQQAEYEFGHQIGVR